MKAWDDMKACAQAIRAPRRPSNLDPAAVATGAALFQDLATGGRCQGCHGGAKWTVSRRAHTPSGPTNEALLTTPYDGAALVAAGFPAVLLPASSQQFMRSPNPPGANDQIQCVLRNVGTYDVSPPDVNVLELKQDMVSAGQGNLDPGLGFNVPSLLGASVGAPFFHAGNARTLEELLGDLFGAHNGALTVDPAFLGQADEIAALVQYLLSIDEDAPVVPLPATPGAEGGDFCAAP